MKNLISVIIPVYKVEAYLNQCIASVVNQTYTNLEIILVDDGSPDNCPAICDAWAEKDSRIRVIHKENGGLSDARNAGLAMASGDFFGFVDSDDYIAPTMYEELCRHLTDTGSDIAACGVQMVWKNGKTAMLTPAGSRILDNEAAMEAIISESWLKQPVWYKLYKRSVAEGIWFETGKFHEDVFWSYQPIARAGRVCVFDTPLYFYRQREGSIMGESLSEKRLDALDAFLKRLAFLKDCYPILVPKAQTAAYFFCMYLCQFALREGKLEVYPRAKAAARQLRPEIRQLPAKEKLWVLASELCWSGTCRLRNELHIGM